MEIINSTDIASTPVRGKRVDREVTVRIRANSVRIARLEAAFRLEQEHQFAGGVAEVIDHVVVERPKHTATSYTTGTYDVRCRVRGIVEIE